MNHHKRIVLDFDDTLAFATNRDWANAQPNAKLIEKINQLYDQGWQIDIFTARGSISCATREEARDKYEPGMIDWLDRHGVKYHSISFEKPLAAYYIDDKGMTPEEFLKKDIQTLQGGLSGSDIYTDGRTVHKVDKRAHLVKAWYESVRDVNVPKVERVVGDTISLEYIQHDPNYFLANPFAAIGIAQQSLEALKRHRVSVELSYAEYVNRIRAHAEASKLPKFLTVSRALRSFDLQQSFSHGDFGVTNLLFTQAGKLYLIDPIPDVFGCTEIDAAKLVASLMINDYPGWIVSRCQDAMMSFNEIAPDLFNTLVSAELIRVYKYHPSKAFIESLITNVF